MFNRKKFNEKAFNAPSYIFKPAETVLVISFKQHSDLKVKRIASCFIEIGAFNVKDILRIKNTFKSNINLAFNVFGELSDVGKNTCIINVATASESKGIIKGQLASYIDVNISLKQLPKRHLFSAKDYYLNVCLDAGGILGFKNKMLSNLYIHLATKPFKKVLEFNCVPTCFTLIPKNTARIFYTDKVHGNYKSKHSFNTDPLNKVPFNGKGSSTKLGTFNINFGVIAENAFKLPNYVITTQYFNMDSKARIRMHEQLDILPMIILDGKDRMEYKEGISLETIIALMADYWTFGWREVPAYKIIWRWSR